MYYISYTDIRWNLLGAEIHYKGIFVLISSLLYDSLKLTVCLYIQYMD